MNTKEISIEEVSELIGVSESQINKNFKQYIPKLEKLNILFEGKGKKRKFYTIKTDIINEYKAAYDNFNQIVYEGWKFNRRIDIDKLIHFMAIILSNQENYSDTSILNHDTIADMVGLEHKTIAKYKKKLVENGIIMPRHLSKTLTYVTKLECKLPSIISELIPNPNNKIMQNPCDDNFEYEIKLKIGDIINQKYEEKVAIISSCSGSEGTTDLFNSYARACTLVANTKNMKNKSELNRVKQMLKNKETEIKANTLDKYIAFQEFKRDLGIDKLWQVVKTEYTPSFMKDSILIDMLVKSFKYKFDNLYKNELDKYLVKYVTFNIQNNTIDHGQLA